MARYRPSYDDLARAYDDSEPPEFYAGDPPLCPECGDFMVDDGAWFCPVCGSRFAEEPPDYDEPDNL